jgi:hypothetical protein
MLTKMKVVERLVRLWTQPLPAPAQALARLRRKSSALDQAATDAPTFDSDGLRTYHYSPFLDDPVFARAWDSVAWTWDGADMRWRLWFLTRCAIQCRTLPGAYVEFGVYRGGCARAILSTVDIAQPFYLFDTFAGFRESQLTERERWLAGTLTDTSAEEVKTFLAAWENPIFCVGDLFDTLPATETGAIAFCHLDLNAAAPTKLALEYLYPRLLPAGIIVMDDYGWARYEDQREILEAFFATAPETIIALPTGQAIAVKLPTVEQLEASA